MGGFVSRRKRSKVEARSVSTQATESRKAGTNELHVECRAEVATDVHERRKIAPALNIGDGHQLDPEIQQHEYTIKKRASSENRKRRGLSHVKPERPKSGSKKGSTQGVDFSTQYDFIGLPGQVLPGYESPVQSNKADKTTASKPAEHPFKEAQQDSEVSTVGIDPDNLIPATEQPREATGIAHKRVPKSPRTRTARSALERPPQDIHSPKEVTVVAPVRREIRDQSTEQDENFNIVKEGSLLAEIRNRDMFGACTDDELGTALRHLCYDDNDNYQLQRTPTSVLSHNIDRTERRSLSADLSPRRQRKKTVTYSDDCKPAQQDSHMCRFVSNYLSDERQPEFRLSLEQIFQENVPCHGEAMEVAAVTGTGSAKVTLPPPEGYHACWNNIEAYRYSEHYAGTTTPSETNFYDLPIEYIHADPAFGGKLKGVKMAAEEIAAQKDDDVLDEEEEEEGCQVDEDMAEDTLDWNVDDRVRSPSETRTDRVILSDDDDDDDNMDMLGDCSIDSMPTTHGQRQSSLTTLKDGDSGRGAIYPSHPHTSSPPETLERVDTKTTPSTQKINELSNRNNTLSPTKEPDNTTETNKTMQDKTGKILMHIGKKTDTDGQKSLLEMQEAEAMTLLLLTGTLPGEDVGGGVSRGAGDAQSQALEHATGTTTTDMQLDENREADERAGLASMLDTQSKTSCQLEELQSLSDNTQNGVGLSEVAPYQDEKPNGNDSSVAGGASTTSHLDNNAPNIPNGDGSSVSVDNPTSASRYIVGHNSATDGGAAAALAESRVEFPLQVKGSDSPGAASSKDDWEVIPVRRVPGQTSLSGSAASGACTTLEMTSDTTLLEMNKPDEQAEEQQMAPVTEGSQVTSTHSSSQPPSSAGAGAGEPVQEEDKIDESTKSEGADDSPRQKRAEIGSDPDEVVPVEKEMAQLNQNANNAASEAVAKATVISVTPIRESTETKRHKSQT